MSDKEQNQKTTSEKPELHPKAAKYIQELLAEKILLDHLKFPNAVKLIEEEIAKIETVGRAPPKESKYIDLQRNKPIRVTSKVLIPVKEFPKFNFIGKILGPKGNSLRRLQEETFCRILIQGRGSMRDAKKEKELLDTLEPKYKHLADELNVEVSAVGAPPEAHARMAYALAELKKYLTPDNTDYISIEQLEEIEKMREYGDNYQERGNYSATPFKKPAAASFQPDRFYETLNKAQFSIDNTYQDDYNQKEIPFSSENYDDPKYGKYFGGGYNQPGYGGKPTPDHRYRAKPYDRSNEDIDN